MPPTQLSAVNPSPKRKRDNLPLVPPLNTILHDTCTPPSGSPQSPTPDSPRNAVANQLRGMTIAGKPGIPVPPLTPTDDVTRKKPKLEAGMATEIPETPQQLSNGETSHALSKMVTLSQPEPVAFTSSPTKNRNQKPRPRNKSPPPTPSALTWQDHEITGHLADPSTDPDDDGTGINGIGFKPTPAIAWARAEKRRQQLMEWRARETKEARAKRSERRRRGVGGAAPSSREGTVEKDSVPKESDIVRRAVRFAL